MEQSQLQRQSQKRRARCEVCGSRRFRRDRNSGQVVCEEGHLQTGYAQEAIEEAPRTRTQSARRLRKEKEQKSRDERPYYRGEEARYLQLQCFQLLLRKQIDALCRRFGFPRELEVVARDLWSCYVSLWAVEPVVQEVAKTQDVPRTNQPMSLPMEAASDADEPDDMVRRMNLEVESDSTDSDDSASTTAAGPMLAGMMSEEEDDKRRRGKRKQYRKVHELDPRRAIHANFTLVICYLSLITLRYPVMVNDLVNWAISRRIPYLQAIDEMPVSMHPFVDPDLLGKNLRVGTVPYAVNPAPAGGGDPGLTSWIRRFVQLYATDFDIHFPPINAAPLLWRCVKSFSLTPLIYERAKAVLRLTQTDLALLPQQKRGADKFAPGKGLPAEAFMAVAILICIRLLWGLEDRERPPFDDADPLAALPGRRDYISALQRLNEAEDQANPVASWSLPVESLSDAQIDVYLDQMQDYLPQASRPAADLRLIERIFPLQPLSAISAEDYAVETEAIISELYEHADPPPIEPMTAFERKFLFAAHGKRRLRALPYTIYHARDVDGDLPSSFEAVLERAERITGIASPSLLAEMSRMEKKLFAVAKVGRATK